MRPQSVVLPKGFRHKAGPAMRYHSTGQQAPLKQTGMGHKPGWKGRPSWSQPSRFVYGLQPLHPECWDAGAWCLIMFCVCHTWCACCANTHQVTVPIHMLGLRVVLSCVLGLC
jgi:hypothetical protein